MANCLFSLLICATFFIIAKADGLSDFSNNLASDLGPLLSLFGDAVTRQYLSESTRFIDYFIFAMAPIGIISTVTAAIRVCGSSSLRAFIGRAQEGQVTTEAELCTSTSADVCELFNKGGITRVLGRPDIVELVYISDGGQASNSKPKDQPKLHLFTSYLDEKSNDSCWPRMEFSGSGNAVFDKIGHSDSKEPMVLAPKPNLSLNVGIRRQPDWAFYAVAIIGFILQAGILVFAGTSAWLLQWSSQKSSSEASRNYAPGIFITGTIILCLGIWSCAALIGQTTNEQYYRRLPGSSDVLYWVQPGPQVIGDQTFGSFAYSDAKKKDRLNLWTSSTKDFGKNFEFVTFIAVSLVLFGYVAQFIGLRGLNAWISIAQLGITLVMSVLRGILRMKRLDQSDNHLNVWQDVVTGHELDWLAFDIAEQMLQKEPKKAAPDTSARKRQPHKFEKKFLWYITGQHEGAIRLEGTSVEGFEHEALDTCCSNGRASGCIGGSSKVNTTPWPIASNDELLQNRIRLSNLTGHFDEYMDTKSYLPWKDERVRVRAKAKCLGAAISQAAATLLRKQPNKDDVYLRVKGIFSYDSLHYEEGFVSVKMKPPSGPDRINWSIDSSQLEAILGLWLWSIIREEYRTTNCQRDIRYNTSISAKRPNSRIFRVVYACYGEQEWSDTVDADMSLWLGSDDLKYPKQSLNLDAYDSYRYSLADDWIMSHGENTSSNQGPRGISRSGDNEKKTFHKVDESMDSSISGLQKLCGWSLIYDVLNSASSEKRNEFASGKVSVDIKGFWIDYKAHPLLDICAQELFITLLRSMEALEFRKIDEMSVSESDGNIRLENSVISALAKCFTDNALGTHSDAMACLIPWLRYQIPSYHEKVLSALIQAAAKCRQDGEWNSAEVILRWACQHYHRLNQANAEETNYFMIALRELGELYRWSLARKQHGVRQRFGAKGIEWMATVFDSVNPIVDRYVTVSEKINKRTQTERWAHELNGAIVNRSRADTLFNLCFAKSGDFTSPILENCLSLVARNGWDEIVSALLEMKANPNAKDGKGRTAVSHSAELGRRQSLRRLIDMDADLDLADKRGITPLAYAAKRGREDVVRLLLETGRVDLKGSHNSGEYSALWLAIDRNYLRIITELLDKGADVNTKNYKGEGLLDLAIRRGSPGVVKMLIEHGLTVGRDQYRIHPLIWAIWRGFADVMRLLLEDSGILNTIHADQMEEAKKLLNRDVTMQPLRNHSDGFFSTLDSRPLSLATISDIQNIRFDPHYSKPPRLMIGINGLRVADDSDIDMCWEASSVSETGFALTRKSYDDYDEGKPDSKVESSDVVWIEFGAEEQEFQVGDVRVSTDLEATRRTTRKIPFQNAFKRKPNVALWLSGLLLSADRYGLSMHMEATEITAEGFNLICKSLDGKARVSWLAYSPENTQIQSGSFAVKPGEYGTRGRELFDKKFERTPRVFLALAGFDLPPKDKHIKVEVSKPDASGFSWSIVTSTGLSISARVFNLVQVHWVAFG